MPKTIKDLNWSLFLINIFGAIATGVVISLAGDFTWQGLGITVLGVVAKDLASFFSDAKKQLSE